MDFVFDSSLVLYLPLYQLDGASFVSKDAHGHLCSVTGALWRPHGYYFDGTDDYISLGNVSQLKFAHTDAFSTFVWLKRTTLGAFHWVIGKRLDASTYRGWDIEFNASNNVCISMDNNNGTGDTIWMTSVPAYSDADSFICVGFSKTAAAAASGITVFVNGEIIEMTTVTDNLTATIVSAAEFTIGARNKTGGYFPGIIAEGAVWNRWLSPIEHQNIYLATKWRYR